MSLQYTNGSYHVTPSVFSITKGSDWSFLIVAKWNNVVDESVVLQVEDCVIAVKNSKVTFTCAEGSVDSATINPNQWVVVVVSCEYNVIDIRTVPVGSLAEVSQGGNLLFNRAVSGKLSIAAGIPPTNTPTYNTISDVIFLDGIRIITLSMYKVANAYPLQQMEWYSNARTHFINSDETDVKGGLTFIKHGSPGGAADSPTFFRYGIIPGIEVKHLPFIISDNKFRNDTDVEAGAFIPDSPPTNLKDSKKSNTWRANFPSNLHLTLTWDDPITIDSIAIPYHNIIEGSVMDILAYLNVPTVSYKLLDISVGSDKRPPHGFDYHWSNSYPYGGGYTWGITFNPITVRRLSFVFHGLINPEQFLEISTVVVGTSSLSRLPIGYGLSMRTDDRTRYDVRQSGNVHIRRGVVNQILSFNLNNMPSEDKTSVLSMIKNTGTFVPVFASLYGHSLSKRERQMHMIYGHFDTVPDITIQGYDSYSSAIDIIEM